MKFAIKRGSGELPTAKALAAVIAVFAMVACAFCVIAPTADVDAADGTAINSMSSTSGVITITSAGSYYLSANLTGKVVKVQTTGTVTIDLNGFTLRNGTTKNADNCKDTLQILSGTAYIVDTSSAKTGTVDGCGYPSTALYVASGATAVLNGGTFTRSAEDGDNKDGTNKTYTNTDYTIENLGNLTINDGVTVENAGSFSSNLVSGSSSYASGTAAVTVINGGTFTGGKYTIKNDYGSTMTINGGTFTNEATNHVDVVQNIGTLTINAGTFSSSTSHIITNLKGQENGNISAGVLTINGGTYSAASGKAVIEYIPKATSAKEGYSFGTITIASGVTGISVRIDTGKDTTGLPDDVDAGTTYVLTYGTTTVSLTDVTAGTSGVTFTTTSSGIAASGDQTAGTVIIDGTASIAFGTSYIVETAATFRISGSTTMTVSGTLAGTGDIVNYGILVVDGGSVSDSIDNNGIVTSPSSDDGNDRRNPTIIDNSPSSSTSGDDDDEAVKVVACAAAAAAAALMAAFFLLDSRKK